MSPSKKARDGKGALSTRGKAKARKRPAGQGKNIKATKISKKAVGAGDKVLARATGEKILGKPVYPVETDPFNDDSGFLEKRLCDGFTFTAGSACAYSCEYCYVESQTLAQKNVRNILKENDKKFNEVVIRRKDVLRHLAQQLTKEKRKDDQAKTADKLLRPALIKRWGLKGKWSVADRVPKYQGAEWEGKVIFASPFVDIAATKELALETVELCDMILRLTTFHIRLLSKSPLLAEIIAKELVRRFPKPKTGAKARMMFGFSTGTINDKVAAAIERHVPSPSARLKALHWLQDKGFRTYGMLCPILPQKDAAAYKACAQEAMQAIRADRCEEIWAEAVNFRAGTKEPTQDPDDQHQRDSFEATHRALLNGGFKDEAALFRNVAEDPTAWEQYTRSLFEALVEAAPQQKDPRLIVGEKAKAPKPKKLWWLQYPRNYESISGYWEKQEINGALLLGGVLTRYRNPKEAANAKQSSAGVVVAAVAPQSLNRRITRLPIRKGEDLLADETLKEPGEVLRGILYGGTKGVLAAPTKLGKSWVLLDLADSVVTGTPWLQWETVKGRVLYVDYELTQALFKKRLRSAQAAKVEKLGNLDFSNLDTVNLKGVKITFEEVVEDLLSKPKEEWYSLVMIDPLYKAIGAGRESIASVVDQFGSLLDKLAKQTGTAVLLAHHFSKSSRSTMPLLERIGNSSVIAKDSDAIIGLDEHPEENCYTVEMKLRYFAPQPKIVIEGGLGVFKLRPDLDAALTGPEESKKEDRSIALLDLLGSDGLRTNEWKKQAVARHVASPATFGRDKKKLIAAKQVCKDEKSKRWQKCAQPSGPAPS